MNKFIKNWSLIFSIALISLMSCEDLDELNINPNGIDPQVADLNLLMPTVLTSVGKNVVGLGFGDIAGVMQHTQKDGWSSGHNDYDWDNDNKSWSGYYGILRTNDELHRKAVEGDYTFHEGVALIMRSYVFGLIADLWGDAPYFASLKAEEGSENFKPVFDSQEDIYLDILATLETANTLLSGSQSSYDNIDPVQDVLFDGDVRKWQKFANSLALRYYLRISEKLPQVAQQGINKIVSDPSTYPIMVNVADDANIGYVGNSSSDSWPTTTAFNNDPSGSYMRLKMCSTLVDKLQEYEDPRLTVWANPIEIPLKVVSGTKVDQIEDGYRLISQDTVDGYEKSWGFPLDFDSLYVGLRPSTEAASFYNLNPNLDQGVYNPHASQLNDIYKESAGDLLQMRLQSSSEVYFILAEAAEKGWISGQASEYYATAISRSFSAWGISGSFNGYLDRAPYNGVESIIEQKWIASWSAAAEAWFDYRRTGLPDLKTGELAKRQALPLRFYYHFNDEISKNTENAEAAIAKLEPTEYKGIDVSNNSAWSKFWLLQGTNKPY
ncbi:SusD/RagB family nutrient-binding outer membrane lipoprotein [Membranihabitans marinus]|uniref:SusD/RagB family nutrient-binding outer membrane lipoprotein n=1 Tax=Membranihabitans marinus TaxID=1227546 RepID=UPI001F45A7B5|nr:SusD/RagB family nutrient-binding outer membrane lipoprotein [Membranihabitans marinus]